MGIHHLTVIRDFANYKRGDRIEDSEEVEKMLGSEASVHVVKSFAKPQPSAVE